MVRVRINIKLQIKVSDNVPFEYLIYLMMLLKYLNVDGIFYYIFSEHGNAF